MNILIMILFILFFNRGLLFINGFNYEKLFMENYGNDELHFEQTPKLEMPQYDENGEIKVFPRIIGGTPAAIGEFRGQVSIQLKRNRQHFCGGTIIHLSHVLTAAHCVTNSIGIVQNPLDLQLMANDLSLNSATTARQVRNALLVFVHPQYNIKHTLNDIAVIRVNNPFTITPTLNYIHRAIISPTPQTICAVAGWGYTSENGVGSPILQRVNIHVISHNVCRLSYGDLLRNGMFCAGSMQGGRDACQGDSGGGLICNDMVAGVVSFGFGCGRPNFPGIYSDVSIFNHWINQTIHWTDGGQGVVPRPTTVIPRNKGSFHSISISIVFISLSIIISV